MNELLEQLAEQEHDGWRSYMGYFLGKCRFTATANEVTLTLPRGYYYALVRLINAKYSELTEAEKEQEQDRDEVRKDIAIFESWMNDKAK